MKTKCRNKLSSCVLCMALAVAMALFTAGCNDSTGRGTLPEPEAGAQADVTVVGEGSMCFTFTVVDSSGSATQFEVHTDKEMVGEALLELGLIDGEEGQYGLFVKTVNGITADYDKDGMYWAFYVNGEYAVSGVDVTPVTEGDRYAFKVERA